MDSSSHTSIGLCIPMNNIGYITSISAELASKEKRFTLDLLREGLICFNKSTPAMKVLCLSYITPWLENLTILYRADLASEERSHEKVMSEIFRIMIEITVNEGGVSKRSLCASPLNAF